MGYPVKVYVAVQNGETKIEIRVFDMEGICYSALMLPVPSGDARLMSLFKDKIPTLEGKTIKLAIDACEKWIKANLGQDVVVREKQTT
jgi:hypothetical protein